MQPFQLRVFDEKKQLDEKMEGLGCFRHSEVFESLPADEQDRLERQYSLMEQYSCVLGERIAAF